MYILDQSSDPASPPPMDTDPLHQTRIVDTTSTPKKRKRSLEDDDASTHPFMTLSSTYLHRQLSLPAQTPSSASSFSELPPLDSPISTMLSSYSRPTNASLHDSKRVHLTPRPRVQRQLSLISSDYSSLASFTSAPIASCHVCHRRPTSVQDIPAYVDCEACNQRTCFICIRTCEGSQCRSSRLADGMSYPDSGTGGRAICGACCVEVGTKGIVWCMACYHNDSDPGPYTPRKTKQEVHIESLSRVSDWLNGCGERSSTDQEMEMWDGAEA